MSFPRITTWAGLIVLLGCASDVADDRLFACEVDRDCRAGWYCVQAVCQATPGPDGLDVGGGDEGMAGNGGGPDAGGPDAGGPDAGGQGGAGGGGGDGDGDGVPDGIDNCAEVANPGQEDADGNGVGDACMACETDQDCYVHVRSTCQGALACEGVYELVFKQGRCVDRVCAQFVNGFTGPRCEVGTQCVQVGDRAECQADDLCLDLDNDGTRDDRDNCPGLPNPAQEDSDRDGHGNLCEPCERNEECFVPGGAIAQCRDALCGGQYQQGGDDGACQPGGICGGFDGVFEDHLRSCPRGTRCQDVAGGVVCVPDPECGAECTPEVEGRPCGRNAGADARCVTGACRDWICEAPECNEQGPRLGGDFEPFVAAMNGNNTFADPRFDATFQWSDVNVRGLTQAHNHCQVTVRGMQPGNWRLPTVYELSRIARRNRNDFNAFDAVGWRVVDRTVHLSRTVVDDNRVMAVRLATGEVLAVPRDYPGGQAEPYSVACIRLSSDPLNLTERRDAWAAGAPDPWTGLAWSAPNEVPFLPEDARMACAAMGKRLPSVDMLLSLLTWSVLDPPGPGYWPGWDGRALGRGQGLVWASDVDDRDANLRSWAVDLGSGEVARPPMGAMLPFFCVSGPGGGN